MEKNPAPLLQAVPMRYNTVKRRINEIGANIKEQLYKVFQTPSFSLELVETTTSDHNALLMAYVRHIFDGEIMEELLFCKCS